MVRSLASPDGAPTASRLEGRRVKPVAETDRLASAPILLKPLRELVDAGACWTSGMVMETYGCVASDVFADACTGLTVAASGCGVDARDDRVNKAFDPFAGPDDAEADAFMAVRASIDYGSQENNRSERADRKLKQQAPIDMLKAQARQYD